MRPYDWEKTRPERIHARTADGKGDGNAREQPLGTVHFTPVSLALGIGLCLATITFVWELSLTTIMEKSFLMWSNIRKHMSYESAVTCTRISHRMYFFSNDARH